MFLITTTQRCGSTWLTRMLAETTGTRDWYVDGLTLGFRLAKDSDPAALPRLAETLRQRPKIQVFKTHDVPSVSFDALCNAMPELRILTIRRDFKDVVVSRYFYVRYHWPTQPALGSVSGASAEYLAQIGDAPDWGALAALLGTKVLHRWACEWRAFEGGFQTPHAIRLHYASLLDGSDFERLSAFTGLPIRAGRSFAVEQRDETLQTGRIGNSRFNRDGRAGQWQAWFSPAQAAELDAMVLPKVCDPAEP